MSFAPVLFCFWFYFRISRAALCSPGPQLPLPVLPVCLIQVDQRRGNLYWVSCEQNLLGLTTADGQRWERLYEAEGAGLRSLHVDWMNDVLLWLEEGRLLAMSGAGGRPKELLQLAGVGSKVDVVFDVSANSLMWNSKQEGRSSFWFSFCFRSCFSNGLFVCN